MKRAIYLLLFVPLTLAAQDTTTLSTTITDQATGAPIPFATVWLPELDRGVAADAQGRVRLQDIPSRPLQVRMSAVGYETLQLSFDPSQGLPAEGWTMTETLSDLSEVVVESSSLIGGHSGLRDTPGAAHFIGPRELQRQKHTDISRILGQVPGVNIQEEDGFGLRPNIGLRGTGVERSSKIAVMEDGILMAPAPYAAPSAYYFPTAGRMAGVEVLKGASQIRFGPYTTGGAINLISTPIPTAPSAKLALSAGTFGQRQLHTVAGTTQGRFGVMVESFQQGADGFKELPGGQNTGFDKQDYLVKLRYTTDPSAQVFQSFTAKLGYAEETSHETYLGLAPADYEANPLQRYVASANDVMNTDQWQMSLRHVAELSDQFSISSVAYRTQFHRNWYKSNDVVFGGEEISNDDAVLSPQDFPNHLAVLQGDAPGSIIVRANNRDYYAQGLQTQANYTLSSGAVDHQITAGLRLHEDEIDRFQWEDEYEVVGGAQLSLVNPGVRGTQANRVERAQAVAGFVQYELSTGPLSVRPGIRVESIVQRRQNFGTNDLNRDRLDDDGGASDFSERENSMTVVIPGVAASYTLGETTVVFAGAHRGFSPAGNAEDTEPEFSMNYELGARYQTPAVSLEAVGFFNDYSNLLGADLASSGGAGTGDQFNGGEVLTAGVEFLGSVDLLANSSQFKLPLRLAYTFTSASFQTAFDSDFDPWGGVQEGDRLPYLPVHSASGGVALEHRLFQVGGDFRYVGEMLAQAGDPDDPTVARTDAYFVADAFALVNATPRLQVFGNIRNLLDNTYVVSLRPEGLRPGLPRTFMLGVKWEM